MQYSKNLFLLGIALFIFGSIAGMIMIKATTGYFSLLFLWVMAIVFLLKTSLSIWALINAKDSAIHSMIGGSLLTLDVSLTLIGIGIPMFFLFPPNTIIGALILLFLSIFYLIHIKYALNEFNEKWSKHGAEAVLAATKNGYFDVLKYRDTLKLKIDILPFAPPALSLAFKVLLILGLLIGGAIWSKDSPTTILPMTLSAFISITFFIQVFILTIKQFFVLKRYEATNNVKLKSAPI